MSDLKPKFIYFDLDDTLLDHKKAERNGLTDVYQHFSQYFNDTSLNDLIGTFYHINKRLWEEYGRGEIDRYILHQRRFQETFQALGIDDSIWKEAGELYMKYYRNHWEWVRGAKKAYNRISVKYPTGLITNGFAETQWMKIRQFGFPDKTDKIVISEEIGVMKPHQKIFDYATNLASVHRSDILYIGDSVTSDVKGGKEAGWKVGWFTSNPEGEGAALADLIFSDFKALLNALE